MWTWGLVTFVIESSVPILGFSWEESLEAPEGRERPLEPSPVKSVPSEVLRCVPVRDGRLEEFTVNTPYTHPTYTLHTHRTHTLYTPHAPHIYTAHTLHTHCRLQPQLTHLLLPKEKQTCQSNRFLAEDFHSANRTPLQISVWAERCLMNFTGTEGEPFSVVLCIRTRQPLCACVRVFKD